MVNKKYFALIFFSLALVLSLGFVSALHNVTNISTLNVLVGVDYTFNFSINNTAPASGAAFNITEINITITGLTFDKYSNGTNVDSGVAHTFTNTSTVLRWFNETVLVRNLTTNYFWFNATATATGTYNLSIKTVNSTSNIVTNFTLTVTDTTVPVVKQQSPVSGIYSNVSTLICNITDNYLAAGVNITVWNSSGGLVFNASNDSLAGTSNSSSWDLSNVLTQNQNYSWVCMGADSSGNTDVNNANNTFILDSIMPGVKLNSPSGNNNYRNSLLFNINLTATDNNIVLTNVSISNATGTINSTTTLYSRTGYNISLAVPGDGNYTINVTTVDLAGNANSSFANITLDTTNPSLNISSPATYINSSSRILGLNITTNDTNFLSVILQISVLTLE